jgi:hypothetical protein
MKRHTPVALCKSFGCGEAKQEKAKTHNEASGHQETSGEKKPEFHVAHPERNSHDT